MFPCMLLAHLDRLCAVADLESVKSAKKVSRKNMLKWVGPGAGLAILIVIVGAILLVVSGNQSDDAASVDAVLASSRTNMYGIFVLGFGIMALIAVGCFAAHKDAADGDYTRDLGALSGATLANRRFQQVGPSSW